MEPDTPLSIEETIAELGDSDHSLLNSRLMELSNLSPQEMGLFRSSWAAIEPKRRRQIVYRLVELAEDNFELNFDDVFKYCLKDEDDEVRCKAIEGLWENEETSLINPLVNLMEHDSSEKVQAAGATALGKFAVLSEYRKLGARHAARIQEALLAVIGDRDRAVEIRRRAMEAMAPMSLPRVRTAILEAYESGNSQLRISAIYAMGKNGDPSWLPILLRELASPAAEARYEAAAACGELEEDAAVPHLIKLVNNPDADVRMAAIRALGKIGGTEAKECLEQCRNNPDGSLSQAAEQALLELRTKQNPLSIPF